MATPINSLRRAREALAHEIGIFGGRSSPDGISLTSDLSGRRPENLDQLGNREHPRAAADFYETEPVFSKQDVAFGHIGRRKRSSSPSPYKPALNGKAPIEPVLQPDILSRRPVTVPPS
jgi:hypothetical protein